MNKYVIAALAVGTVAGAAVTGGNLVSAHRGGGEEAKQNRAEIAAETLGVTVEEVTEAKQAGELEELLTANGFEDKDAFFEASLDVIRENLTEEGELSAEEIDEKIASIEERRAERQARLQEKADEAGLTVEEFLEQRRADRQERLEERAAELGVSVDELKEDLKEWRNNHPFRGGHGGPDVEPTSS